MSEMHEMHELHQMRETETGQITGTMDKDYNLFRYIETCLENALRMETYRRDAERGNDTALAALFTMAQKDNRKGAEIGKKLLASRLSNMFRSDEVGESALASQTEESALRDEIRGRATSGEGEGMHTGPLGAETGQPPVDVMAPSPPREEYTE